MSEIVAYRLVKKKWLKSAFDGEGAKRFGGSWNSRGKTCVYVAGSESLAMLEVMVHLDDYRVLQHYALPDVRLPSADVRSLPADQWPEDWRTDPAPPETAEIGDAWLEEGASLALAVPSVIVPREQNFMLNPTHPNYNDAVFNAKQIDVEPDRRL